MTASPSDLPHVTGILKATGMIPDTFFTEYARERGTAVHLATEYHDRGMLDRTSIDPAIAGRLTGYERFLSEMRPNIIKIEDPFESIAYGYQGKRDRLLTINGVYGVLDIKPPSKAHWHALQLAAYAAPLGPDVRRWSLHLGDGTYTLIEHPHREARRDFQVFLACLSVYSWQLRHGLTVPEVREDRCA